MTERLKKIIEGYNIRTLMVEQAFIDYIEELEKEAGVTISPEPKERLSDDLHSYMQEAPFVSRDDVSRWKTKAVELEQEVERLKSLTKELHDA